MDTNKNRNVIVFPILPRYAHAILSGEKTVEFRRNGAPASITHIVVYSTKPDQVVLGYCNVARCVVASPQELWRNFGIDGQVDREHFFAYFEGHTQGICYVLENPERFINPVPLEDCWSLSKPPQSFVYTTKREWTRLRKRKKQLTRTSSRRSKGRG